jgi:hypothetical protein
MGAYRYLLFPKHHQPTAAEAAELHSFIPLLKGRWAIGYERKTECLAILFDQEIFEQAMTDDGFEMLVRKWQVHGCELTEKLKFVKDSAALKPTPLHVAERHLSPERILRGKKYMAEEAVAKSLLNVQRTLERLSWLERVGKAMPYLMIACGTIGLLATGWYVHHRLSNAGRERRTETIERMADTPEAKPTEINLAAEELPAQ